MDESNEYKNPLYPLYQEENIDLINKLGKTVMELYQGLNEDLLVKEKLDMEKLKNCNSKKIIVDSLPDVK